jgi:hypothetical protein
MSLRVLFSSLLLPALAGAIPAQAYGTDLLALAGGGIFNNKLLYQVAPSGQVTPLHLFPLLLHPTSLTHDRDNRNLVLDYTNPFAVVVFDPAAGQALATLHAGAPLRDVLAVRPFHTGDYLVAEGLANSSVQLVRADGSGPTALLAPGADRIEALAEDLLTGHVLVGVYSSASPSLVRLDPRTGQVTALDATPRLVTALVQDHRDGAVYYGTTDDAILRWHPGTGVSTFVAAGHPAGVQARSLAFDRAAGDGILVAGGTQRLVRLDFAPGGAPVVVAVHGDLPPWPLAVMDVMFRHERNVASRRLAAGNRWGFDLSFPGEAGRGYVLAFSATGFAPGIAIGSLTLPLVPDGAFAASVSGSLGPVLQHGSGTLDGAGRASATLDLSVFGPLPGVRLWAAAGTLDPTAPAGVRTISKPVVVVLE